MIRIAPLATLDEFREAVTVQRTVWGFSDLDLLPVRFFVVASKIGGQALGAFDGDRLVGFSIAIPGLKPGGRTYLHSHMLGVLDEYNNRGIGRMLKLRQREEALANGVPLIEWTFDPLELKNAYFNIERLGAVIRRYVHNQYGASSSHLHGGLPTDRCIAEWWIDTERVEAAINGRPGRRPALEASIEVPADISAIKREDPGLAREIQQKIADRFEKLFGMGLAVVGFDRSETNCSYLLGFWK